jgi:hypothetical protein
MIYIGHQYTYRYPSGEIELVPQKDYPDAEITFSGSMTFVNNQMQLSDDRNTSWVKITPSISIPYAPSLLPNFWQVGEEYTCMLP